MPVVNQELISPRNVGYMTLRRPSVCFYKNGCVIINAIYKNDLKMIWVIRSNVWFLQRIKRAITRLIIQIQANEKDPDKLIAVLATASEETFLFLGRSWRRRHVTGESRWRRRHRCSQIRNFFFTRARLLEIVSGLRLGLFSELV